MRSFGPFQRKKSPTQTYEIALKQKTEGELWGRAIRHGGSFPAVKAYLKPLCDGMPPGSDCVDSEGIEFVAELEPTYIFPGGLIVWRMENPAKAGLRRVDDETIALSVIVTKIVYSELKNQANPSHDHT